MVCQVCGRLTTEGVRFCSNCGSQVAAAAPVYAPGPSWAAFRMRTTHMQSHVRTLGILWCVFGAYRVLGSLIAIFFLRMATMRSFGNDSWPFGTEAYFAHSLMWMNTLVPLIAIHAAIVMALAFFVGFSLLSRKPWGRTLAIVVAILALLKPVLGTALGIYTLWVLAPNVSGLEYEEIADRT